MKRWLVNRVNVKVTVEIGVELEKWLGGME